MQKADQKFEMSNAPEGAKVKITVVGDTNAGKSSLIVNYLNNKFDEKSEPTVLDLYKGVKTVKGVNIKVDIHDTSGDQQVN